MHVLKDLWYGNLAPGERYTNKNSEYAKARQQLLECLERLSQNLSPEATGILEEFCDKCIVETSLLEEDAFIRGVRIGAGFILDVVGEHRSPLLPISQ